MKTLILVALVGVLTLVQSHKHKYGHWDSGSSEENYGWKPKRGPECLRDVNRFREERNKQLTKEFVEQIFAKKDLTQLDRLICREEYIQHNPGVQDGLQAVKNMFGSLPEYVNKVQENFPIKLLSAEGDLTYVGYQTTDPVTKNTGATIDVFRFCDKPRQGRCICEHWDVQQSLPDGTVHPHPLFNY